MNGNGNGPLGRPTFLPPLRPAFVVDSIESDDPLIGNPPTRRVTPAPSLSVPTNAGTPVKRKLAVVLKASPRQGIYQDVTVKDEDLENPIVSDLSRQFKQSASSKKPVKPASIDAAQPTPRGRGRPKVTRHGLGPSGIGKIHSVTAAGSREARQIKTVPSMNGYGKRRGRPPKQPSPPPREVYHKVEVPFVAFLCEWKGCRAELHNLDTLRKHVYVVHGREEQCQWGKCATKQSRDLFPDNDSFGAHVEEAHLVPFAWHVGDGPQNLLELRPADDDIPDFLKDDDGNQVTPSVKNQQVEDIVTWRANRRKLRELIIRRDEGLPDEDDDDAVVEEAAS